MKAKVYVTLKSGVLDPQGQAVARALGRLGFSEGKDARIGKGYPIACEAGRLDGALTRNASLHFECRDVHLSVEGKPTPFTRAIPAGRVLRIPIAHAEGRFVHPNVEQLEKEGRVVFRYVD